MKTSSPEVNGWVFQVSHQVFQRFTFLPLLLLVASQAFGQAPSLLWSTNIGATLFAVDNQTNSYANVGGSVIVINPNGVPVSTNVICPRPGFARRDAGVNYYFSGILSNFFNSYTYPPQDFAGVMLSNNPVYLAKFSAGGSLLWVTNFVVPAGSASYGVGVHDLILDPVGNPVVGYYSGQGFGGKISFAVKFNTNGIEQWTSGINGNVNPGAMRLAAKSPTNVVAVWYFPFATGGSLYLINNTGGIYNQTGVGGGYSIGAATVLNSFGDMFHDENGITKRNPALAVQWTASSAGYQRPVGPDKYDGVHVASSTAGLARYAFDGSLAWTQALSANCLNLILDDSGNRFLELAGGSVARLGAETFSSPVITTNPVGKTIFAKSNYLFSVGASGSDPLVYSWLFNAVPMAGKTNASMTLSNLSSAQTGNYSVIVSNFQGSVTSTPALLRVKTVQFFIGSQMLTNGTYSYLTPPTLSVLSAFTNGSEFYTLNGSAPSFTSTPYSAPFVVPSSATVRALGYSSDFSQSEEADPVNIILPPTFSLSVTSTPGGNVTLNPPGGAYLSNTVVTATATATNIWSFLYWLGDTSGGNPSANLTMNANKSIQAVFGTTLSTSTAGGGSVFLYPAGGVYPYGTTVRLTGVPQPGNYFGVWGNAASGNTNPLYFTITSPSPTVSSLFASTPAGQAALTVVITGKGQVNVEPRANAYATNQSVTLTATPDAGETFLRWSGSASGSLNPLILGMNQDRVVVANFTGPFRLRADQPGLEGLLPQGFRFTVMGDPFAVYQIYSSSNLNQWIGIGSLSNNAPETQFTDPSATNSPRKFYKATQ